MLFFDDEHRNILDLSHVGKSTSPSVSQRKNSDKHQLISFTLDFFYIHVVGFLIVLLNTLTICQTVRYFNNTQTVFENMVGEEEMLITKSPQKCFRY